MSGIRRGGASSTQKFLVNHNYRHAYFAPEKMPQKVSQRFIVVSGALKNISKIY